MNTLRTPSNPLDPRVVTAWRLEAALSFAVPLIALVAVSVAGDTFGIPAWVPGAALGLLLAGALIGIGLVPAIRYRRWRWEVRDEKVRLREGLIIVTHTVIPMVRVQHVDTAQGPIMRALGLTDVHIWTAAGRHVIPALTTEHAEDLRDRIAALARVTDDGGL